MGERTARELLCLNCRASLFALGTVMYKVTVGNVPDKLK